MSKLSAVAAIVLGTLVLSACGEKSQVIVYRQGQYQGKADTQPWNNETFKGDKTAWETALKVRNQAQNEYKRTN